MNIQPAYVTFEQAKWLKEKGFRHNIEGGLRYEMGGTTSTNGFWDYNICKYEQWQVIEWLRVNHGIHIVIMPKQLPDNSVVYYIWKGKKATFKETFYNSPQEAYSAAFDYVLTNLI